MEELNECIPADSDVESEYRAGELRRAINRFVHDLSEEKRAMFVRRYFYTQSVDEIAVALGVGSSKVKVSLMRMRNALQKTLEEQELM
jgi:RNA polymerase sigma-70 factor (ECF subfamily)